MEYDLNDIVSRKRSTSTDYHLLIARGWRRLGEPSLQHSPLAYSAFELRSAIERTLFEFLWLTQGQKLTDKDFNIANKLTNLVKEILKRQGGPDALQRKLRFARAFAEGISMPQADWPAVLDIKKLEKMWSALSEYCHRQLEPEKTWEAMGDNWVRRGYALVKEVESYLWNCLVDSKLGWLQPDSLPPEMVTARDQYLLGELDDRSLKTRMKLMEPVLEMRRGRNFTLNA